MGSGFRTNVTYIQLKTQEKTHTPYRYGETVLPDAGYDAMTKLHLNDVPKYVKPCIGTGEQGDICLIGCKEIVAVENGYLTEAGQALVGTVIGSGLQTFYATKVSPVGYYFGFGEHYSESHTLTDTKSSQYSLLLNSQYGKYLAYIEDMVNKLYLKIPGGGSITQKSSNNFPRRLLYQNSNFTSYYGETEYGKNKVIFPPQTDFNSYPYLNIANITPSYNTMNPTTVYDVYSSYNMIISECGFKKLVLYKLA